MKAKSFEFTKISFKPYEKRIFFGYKINFYNSESIDFKEEIILPKVPNLKYVPSGLVSNILDDLHIALGISYYKLYCPKNIILNKKISKEMSDFWNTVYTKGLGEFFYKNKIKYKNLIKFPYFKNINRKSFKLNLKNRSLVGVGGGKDSIVTIEALKDIKADFKAFVVESSKSYEDVDSVLRVSDIRSLKIKRIIDKKLLENNFPKSYNGHIPISSIYAFLGILGSIFYNYKYIIVSNEFSSNFGNIRYLGESINHQWSKSEEFERILRNYSVKYLTGDIIYFSLLRPFYEIRIAKEFSKHKKYFSSFSSCNNRFKINKNRIKNKWCGVCPKCVFVFMMMSAYLSKKDILKIFGKNLYNSKDLEPMFLDLLGFGKMKPFECVGTFEESRLALKLSESKFKDSYIINKLSKKIKVSDDLKYELLSSHKSFNVPTEFLFLIAKSILISGYGKEGTETYKYLNSAYPKKNIKIAKSVDTKEYKKNEKLFDLSIKSPGIPSRKIGINYTTATNIFFSKFYGKNKIIGITGSKGKSTTASLIKHILDKAGIKNVLLGNIGKPMLSYIDLIKKSEVIILELSSYQLEDMQLSPNVSVITNLFPEHMDYHGSLADYYKAKKNILNFQNPNDIFFYNGRNKILSNWSLGSTSKVYDFSNIKIKNINTSLIGDHNLLNIKSAISVARTFAIKDKIIIEAINSFKTLSHRLEFLGNFKGIDFYDDAISTTPESTIMAISAIPNVETIFLGGEDRGYDFNDLIKKIKNSKIKNIVLFPDSGENIKVSDKYNVLRTKKMEEAVKFAFNFTSLGNACLLSCASPSYSLWKNFEEKGDEFKKNVLFFSKKK